MSMLNRLFNRKSKIDPEIAKQLGLNADGKALVEGKTAEELQQEAARHTQEMDAEVQAWQTDLPKDEAAARTVEAQAKQIEASLNAAERK